MGLFDFFKRKSEEPEEEREEEEPERIEEEEAPSTILYGPRGEEISRVEVKPVDFDEVTEPDLGEVKSEIDEILEARAEKEPIMKTEQEIRAERMAEMRARIEERKVEIEEKRLEKEYAEKYTARGKVAGVAVGVAKGVGLGAVDVGKGFKRRAPERKGVAGRMQEVAYKTATLGGAVRISRVRKHLYVPKTQPELYSSAGMKKLSLPDFGKMRRITTLGARRTDLFGPSPLAEATTRPLPTGMVRVGESAQDMTMERLRGVGFPSGLSRNEKLAYSEIKANHDIDTKSHVISELMDLGVDRREAIRAVDELMKRKVVKRGKPFKGEPTLEVVR